MKKFIVCFLLVGCFLVGCTSPPHGRGGDVSPVPVPAPLPTPINDATLQAKLVGLRSLFRDRQIAADFSALLDALADVTERNSEQIQSTADVFSIVSKIGQIRFRSTGITPPPELLSAVDDVIATKFGGKANRQLEKHEATEAAGLFRAMAVAIRGN